MSYAAIGGALAAGGAVGSAAIAGSGGGKKGAMRQAPLRNYGSTRSNNALQMYLGRLLASNVNTRPPTFDEWVNSDGKAQFELNDPGLTPSEAMQLNFTDDRGIAYPTFDPSHPRNLTIDELAYAGHRRRSGKAGGDDTDKWNETPAQRLARLVHRRDTLENRLSSDGLSPERRGKINSRLKRVNKKIDRWGGE